MRSDRKDLASYQEMRYVLNEVVDSWLDRSKLIVRKTMKTTSSPIPCEFWVTQFAKFAESYFQVHFESDLTHYKHSLSRLLNPETAQQATSLNSVFENLVKQGYTRDDILSEIVEIFAAVAVQAIEASEGGNSLVYQLTDESQRSIEVTVKIK